MHEGSLPLLSSSHFPFLIHEESPLNRVDTFFWPASSMCFAIDLEEERDSMDTLSSIHHHCTDGAVLEAPEDGFIAFTKDNTKLPPSLPWYCEDCDPANPSSCKRLGNLLTNASPPCATIAPIGALAGIKRQYLIARCMVWEIARKTSIDGKSFASSMKQRFTKASRPGVRLSPDQLKLDFALCRKSDALEDLGRSLPGKDEDYVQSGCASAGERAQNEADMRQAFGEYKQHLPRLLKNHALLTLLKSYLLAMLERAKRELLGHEMRFRDRIVHTLKDCLLEKKPLDYQEFQDKVNKEFREVERTCGRLKKTFDAAMRRYVEELRRSSVPPRQPDPQP
jgi:hypothetical protein